MIKKKYLFFLILLLSTTIFGKTNWKSEDGRIRVIYKVLDPLIVTVEQPKRIIASTLDKKFTYSSKNGGEMLRVKVYAPYNKDEVDNYLRKIYERVYFELENDGVFKLYNESGNPNIFIDGKGFFVDTDAGITAGAKNTHYDKEFKSNVGNNAFTATTNIDAEFSLPQGEAPLGVYRGALILKVWFGGSIGGNT